MPAELSHTHTHNSRCPAQDWQTECSTPPVHSAAHTSQAMPTSTFPFVLGLIVSSLCRTVKANALRSQILRLAGPQYSVLCGILPKHAVCGFEGIRGTRWVEMLQLCLLEIQLVRSSSQRKHTISRLYNYRAAKRAGVKKEKSELNSRSCQVPRC